MSVPIIASAEGGLLSPVTNITEQTSKTVENVPKAVEAPIKQNSIVEKTVKQTAVTVTGIVKETTNKVEQVEKAVQKTTNEVTSVSKPVQKATESVQTIEKTIEKTVNVVVPVEDSKTGIDADLSDKPSIKVNVLDQEASVSAPSSPSKQPTANVEVPVVSDIVKTKQVLHQDKPATVPAVDVKTENDSRITTQKPANIQEKELIARNKQEKSINNMSGEKPIRQVSKTNNKLPVSKKSYPDYPASKIIIPSHSQGGGQSSSNNSTNSSMANVNSIAFLAIIDGNSSDSLLSASGRFHGKVRHYFDQWLNAPPGQPPQSFFF
jgi:hypothetical protein